MSTADEFGFTKPPDAISVVFPQWKIDRIRDIQSRIKDPGIEPIEAVEIDVLEHDWTVATKRAYDVARADPKTAAAMQAWHELNRSHEK